MSRREEQFWEILQETQEYISARYAAALADPDKKDQLREYVVQHLREAGYAREENSTLADELFREMAEYGILTPYLSDPDLEEINVNGWNDITLTHTDGRLEKLKEHFHSPQHAEDILKRLLQHSGMILDNAKPVAQGHLPGNTRITAAKTPVVDRDRGVAASIRILHPQKISLRNLAENGFATEEMLSFLCDCVQCGVPFVIAGATSSGKTTLLNAILQSVPDSRRVYTIESGARELSLVKRDADGNICNNVVHTLSRPSEKKENDISQEDLVVMSLRFNPDIICVGEMRDVECYAAVEASLTGHTVVSTVHAFAGKSAHTRIALLCQKRFPLPFETSVQQAVQAFPIVAYTHKMEDGVRRLTDITEGFLPEDGGKPQYNCLYRYTISENRVQDGRIRVDGRFCKAGIPSGSLQDRLKRNGLTWEKLSVYCTKGEEIC